MIKTYLLTAIRHMRKKSVYTAINMIGLAIGMAACILIFLFVFYERGFDEMHKKNIYRLNEVQKFEGMLSSQKVALSMFPMGPTLLKEFPEIVNFTRLRWEEKVPLNYGDKRVFLPHLYFVDTSFLGMFDFPLLEGNRKDALSKPNSIVLTKSAAQKFFGTEEAIGKTIKNYGNDTTAVVVTGVLDDIPQNSQFQFDALLSMSTIERPSWMENWGGNWLNTYLQLAPGTDMASLEKRFPDYLKKYMTNGDNWKHYELFLLPLRDVHDRAGDIGLDYINYQKFDRSYTNIFFSIALVVLLIACINFMNLSTARSSERAREVGVRKTLGAYRWQLAAQFVSESVLLTLAAMLIAVLLAKLALPWVNQVSQRQLQLPVFSSPNLLMMVLGGSLVIGLLAGLYPAVFLSSFRPTRVLKGAISSGRNRAGLRNALVVVQFASAIFLMIATFFAVKQLRYMQDRNPGFSREQVVNIPLSNEAYQKFDLLKESLEKSSLIQGVTAAQDELGSHLDQSGIEFRGDGPKRQLTGTRLIVDPDYLKFYQIPLVAGSNFSHNASSNGKEYIVNEEMARELLKDSPNGKLSSLIGKTFGFDSLGTIVGIAKNFNFNSLHYKIETLFLFNQKQWGFSTLSVKINAGKAKEALAFIQSTWETILPSQPYEYQFLDDHFKEVYRSDSQVSSIVGVLAALAIFISCLGLFGLATYSAERRIKEVGIRKVLGASNSHITTMLTRDFLKYVLIALLIAWPVAWWAVSHWLQDYAFRVKLSWWVFGAAGLLAMLIALITVSFQAIRAAWMNPVTSLRSE